MQRVKIIIRRFKNIAHMFLAIAANILYGFPSKEMSVIGVTGTDGKTTTASLIYHILHQNGFKTALISTVGAVIDDKDYDTGFHVTTPSPFKIQKYLKIAREKGCTHAVVEVTSHALDQNRVWGVDFKIGVLTNVTHEHLDYHRTYKNYVMTKIKLLLMSDVAISSSSGEWFKYVKDNVPHSKLKTYSLAAKVPSDFSIKTCPFQIKTDLFGDFNLENILGASLTALELGISSVNIDKAVQTYKPPLGRQQRIIADGFEVMIDFAHTPNALEKILTVVRKETIGYLIHVFGSAGKRDITKRPLMGKAASSFADIIILTAEDPRGEDIEKINAQIAEGIDEKFQKSDKKEFGKTKKVFISIPDRADAIAFAVSLASKNDTVLITGKGHEKSINYTGREEQQWSDEVEVMRSLNAK